MIWSLIKIILFVALVAALTFGASTIIETGGQITISFGASEVSLTPLAGIIGLLIVLATGWLAFRLISLAIAVLRFFNGDETAISRYFDRNRERRGFEALADGLMALASGEGRLAMAKATRAEKFLARPELTLLISAQAAEMSGETGKAQAYYKKLVTDERTRFVGVQGILKQKLADGDTETALKLAQKAFALRPRHEKTQDLLFSLQSEKSDWKGARATLAAKLKFRSLPKDVHMRRDAVLALAEAREMLNSSDVEGGRVAALHANRLSPGLVPAAVLASEMHIANASAKNAAKVLKKAWGIKPHPDLAAAFAEIAPDETASERMMRFQTLLKIHADDPESRLLAAELAIVAEDFPRARKSLGELTETDPTTRSLTIMAAIERGEGAEDKVVRGWLARALNASRGPQWVCTSCNTPHGDWQPVCDHCGHFDTLDWTTARGLKDTPKRPTDMLPLIVGALEDRSEPAPEDAVEGADKGADKGDGQAVAEDEMEEIVGDVHAIPANLGRNSDV